MSEPGVSEPGVSEPDVSEPAVSEPDGSEPDDSAPDESEPGVTEPGAPDVDGPEIEAAPDDTSVTLPGGEGSVPVAPGSTDEIGDGSLPPDVSDPDAADGSEPTDDTAAPDDTTGIADTTTTSTTITTTTSTVPPTSADAQPTTTVCATAGTGATGQVAGELVETGGSVSHLVVLAAALLLSGIGVSTIAGRSETEG